MKPKLHSFLIIVCIQLLFSCSNKNNIDPFLGEWTSYDKDLKISMVDTLYHIEYLDRGGQITQSYNGNKVGDLLSYRDNGGIGRQITVYVPVDTRKPNDKNGKPILDYTDSVNIRLSISGDGDYYKKFTSVNEHGLKGFAGTWKMKTKNFANFYAILNIDSTSEGIRVTDKYTPNQKAEVSIATFNQDILNIPAATIDGGLNATYFKDCDCITIENNKYYRYNENDLKFLGHWKNENGEIKISKNGDYYLVRTHEYQDYTFDFLTEVKGNTLQEPFDKYAQGRTYTTITFLSPGVISDNGGENKYYNSNKYSKEYDYSQNTTSTSTTSAKSFSGNIGKLQASYNLTWNTDGTIYGTYYYPQRPNTIYTLKGRDLGNGSIQLTEYTGNNISAHCNLSLQGSCYVGQMNNTDGRIFTITMCQ